ncbi:N,N-dimethylformamidase beta subunit family domain-containing protein [Spirillospora sp. CA-108201]
MGSAHEIEGYAGHVSMRPGERFHHDLRVHCPGLQDGLVRRRPGRAGCDGPGSPGVRQAGTSVDEATRTVSAPWRRSPSLIVPTSGWPGGSYLIMLKAASGARRYMPVTVRSPSAAGRLVALNATTMWHGLQHVGRLRPVQGPGGSGRTIGRARSASTGPATVTARASSWVPVTCPPSPTPDTMLSGTAQSDRSIPWARNG